MHTGPRDHRRRCSACNAPQMAITREQVRGRSVLYRWTCAACGHHAWMPAPVYLGICLVAGVLLAAGGVAALVWWSGPDGGAGPALAAAVVGAAMTAWGIRWGVPLRRHPRVD